MRQVSTMSSKLENIFAPRSLSEASALLTKYDGEIRLLAAGTDLILAQEKTRYLIGLSHLGLNYIERRDKHLAVGSMTTITDIADSGLFDEQPYSLVKSAALLFGSCQIRNRATIGGNICSAVPSADMPVALIALDAKVETLGPEGTRAIKLEDFIVDYRRTDLKKGELLKEIQIPLFGTESRGDFQKLSRTGVDIALVNCSTRWDPKESDFRIVMGAVGPTPVRAKRAEGFLRECKELDERELVKASRIAGEETKPISDLRASSEYRRAMSEVFVYRSLRRVLRL